MPESAVRRVAGHFAAGAGGAAFAAGLFSLLNGQLSGATKVWLALVCGVGAFVADMGRTHRRSRIAWTLATIGLAIAITAVAGALVRDGRSSRTTYVDFWDASGKSVGIRIRDTKSPWTDSASINRIENAFVPGMADLRKFLRVNIVGQPGGWSRSARVSPEDELSFMAVAMNTADADLLFGSIDERGVVRGLRIGFGVSDNSTSSSVFAVLIADNIEPRWIASSIELRSDEPVCLWFVPATAAIRRGTKAETLGDEPLNDNRLVYRAKPNQSSIVGQSGELLGSKTNDGKLELYPDGYVSVTFR